MKKLLGLVLAIMMAVIPCLGTAETTYDFSSMTAEDLAALIAAAQEALLGMGVVAEEDDGALHMPAEGEEPAEELVLFDQDGLKVVITSIEFTEYYDLKVNVTVINNTDYEVNISLEDVSVNDWTVYAGGVYGVQAGKKAKDYFYFSSLDEDAEVMSVEDLEYAEFTIRVYDSETYDDLFTLGPVKMIF